MAGGDEGKNLVVVRDLGPIPGGKKPMLGFETITMAPIDVELVETAMLAAAERDWLNAYHARVRETVGPLVDEETRPWLDHATRAI